MRLLAARPQPELRRQDSPTRPSRTAPSRCPRSRCRRSFARHRCDQRADEAGMSAGSALQSGSRFEHRRERVGDIVALERAPARQHLVQHAAERPDVAPLVRRRAPAPARDSCRRRCRESCPRRSSSPGVVIVGDCRSRPPRCRCGLQRLRQAEVQHLHRAVWSRTLMFAGFRSRWMIPCSCAASSASAICLAIGSASSSGIGAAARSDRPASAPRPAPCTSACTPSDVFEAVDRARCADD